jgi:hypothetical protein
MLLVEQCHTVTPKKLQHLKKTQTGGGSGGAAVVWGRDV